MKKIVLCALLCVGGNSYAKRVNLYPLANFSTNNLSLGATECVARMNMSKISPYKWLVASDYDDSYSTEEEVKKYGTIHQGKDAADYLKNSDSRNSGEGSVAQYLSVINRMMSKEHIHDSEINTLLNLSKAEKEIVMNIVVKDSANGSYTTKPVSVKTIVHATERASIDASMLSLRHIGMQTEGINNLVTMLTFGIAPAAMQAFNSTIIEPWNNTVNLIGERQRKEKLLRVSEVTEKRINQVLNLLSAYEAIRLLEYSCSDSEEDVLRQQQALAKYLSQATSILNDFLDK